MSTIVRNGSNPCLSALEDLEKWARELAEDVRADEQLRAELGLKPHQPPTSANSFTTREIPDGGES